VNVFFIVKVDQTYSRCKIFTNVYCTHGQGQTGTLKRPGHYLQSGPGIVYRAALALFTERPKQYLQSGPSNIYRAAQAIFTERPWHCLQSGPSNIYRAALCTKIEQNRCGPPGIAKMMCHCSWVWPCTPGEVRQVRVSSHQEHTGALMHEGTASAERPRSLQSRHPEPRWSGSNVRSVSTSTSHWRLGCSYLQQGTNATIRCQVHGRCIP
jgi:hypothetical protein